MFTCIGLLLFTADLSLAYRPDIFEPLPFARSAGAAHVVVYDGGIVPLLFRRFLGPSPSRVHVAPRVAAFLHHCTTKSVQEGLGTQMQEQYGKKSILTHAPVQPFHNSAGWRANGIGRPCSENSETRELEWKSRVLQ